MGHILIAGRNRILRNDGTAGFTEIDPFPGLDYRIAAADVDGDGDQDVSLGPPARLMRNEGGMTFTEVTAAWIPTSPQVVVSFAFGDFDADGDPDLVLGGTAGNDELLLNLGTRFVAVPGILPPSLGATYFPCFADVDEDGDLDLWRSEQTSTTSALTLALNVGTGFVAVPSRLPGAPLHVRARVAEDLAGAGDVDVDVDVVTSAFGGATVVWNRHRHLACPAPPRVGQLWTVELSSQPGYGATTRFGALAIGLVRRPQRVQLPPFGALWLDLAAPVTSRRRRSRPPPVRRRARSRSRRSPR